jgi:hypothetical protein
MFYVFVPEDIDVSSVKANLLGAYVEASYILPASDVERMMSKSKTSRIVPELYDLGYLEGFGNSPLLVIEVNESTLKLVPVSSNLFKIIESHVEDFTVDKELSKVIPFSYNLEIAIDCDIFPYIGEDYAYSVYKMTLSHILLNLHSLLPKLRVYLLNPCYNLMLAGAELGIKTCSKCDNVLSVRKGSSVRVNSGAGFSIMEMNKIIRTEDKEDEVPLTDVWNMYSYFRDSKVIDSYEATSLLSRMFFETKSTLNILLPYNPLDGSE